jgi:hypothetical protein
VDLSAQSDRFVATNAPAELQVTMLRAANGELAWPIGEAAAAVSWIASKGLAILGGEAWLVGPAPGVGDLLPWGHDDAGHVIFGFVPFLGSSTPAVRGWGVEAQQPHEEWDAFVARCHRESLAALAKEAEAIQREVPTAIRDKLRYNLTFTSKEEYSDL